MEEQNQKYNNDAQQNNEGKSTSHEDDKQSSSPENKNENNDNSQENNDDKQKEQKEKETAKSDKALIEAQTHNAKLKKQLEEMNERMAKYEEAEAQKMQEEQQKEEDRLRQKGDYDALMKKQKEAAEKKELELNTNLKKAMEMTNEYKLKLENTMVLTELKQAITKHKLVEGASVDIVTILKPFVKLGGDNDTLICTDPETGEPTTIDEMVTNFIDKRPHYKLDDTPSGTGSPKKTTNSNNKEMSIDEQIQERIIGARGGFGKVRNNIKI